MVQRLTPAEQQQVDLIWQNLLGPARPADEQTLLDCLIVYQLHHRGVDELHARSVKQTPRGKIVMTIDFDRDYPADDRFTVKLVSRLGWTIREHTWSAGQVRQTLEELFGQSRAGATTQPLAPDVLAKLEHRLRRIAAATQPS